MHGQSMSFKSFVAEDIGGHVANGWNWGDRKTQQGAVVYIAAEGGAAGVRKRIVGFQQYNKDRGASEDVPFYMTSVAPNLGTGNEDLKELISAIDATGAKPAFITLDTIAQSLGGADENGQGMAQFVVNATALANHFSCFVLCIHHVGLQDDQRMRGWSGLKCGIDVELLCEREKESLTTTIRLRKLKDEETSLHLKVSMERVVIGHDEDGDEISTLVVDSIEDAEPKASVSRAKAVPPSQRLLMAVVAEAIDEDGQTIRSFINGPLVRAVDEDIVRERFYARIAENPKPDDTPKKLADRQRQAFNTSIKENLKAQRLVAALKDGRRVLWLP